MAPVVQALTASGRIRPVVVVTGQHREMLDQVLELFRIVPTEDLRVLRPGQSLTGITTAVLAGLQPVYARHNFDAVVVQGDTTTTMAAALAAFYARVPVAHLEAGLRTFDPWSPYPEEINRRLTTQLTSLHLAPTPRSRANLLAEGIAPSSVVVTGNTVIDALLGAVDHRLPYGDQALEDLDRSGRPVILLTAHRRESWGEPMRGMAAGVARIARAYPELTVVFPMHRNPVVRDAVTPWLQGCSNVLLTEPLSYGPFARLMNRSHLLLTDSGGIQEEGPSLGKPVLVLRDTTERPEAIEAGTARLIGTDPDRLWEEVTRLLDDSTAYQEMAQAVNPYGDGLAAQRVEAALARFLGLTDDEISEFSSVRS